MNQTKIYTLTPDQVASFRAQFASTDNPLPVGNFGKWSPPGHPEITLSFAYDGKSDLTLTILHDAWFETCGEIWGKLDSYLLPAS